MKRTLNKNVAKFGAPHYRVLAMIIRDIEGAEMRKKVSDHFGAAFNARSTVFNFYEWSRSTGADKIAGEKNETAEGH